MSSLSERSVRTDFQSVLCAAGRDDTQTSEPDYFDDLNLDHIWEGMNSEDDRYTLAPYFYTRLHTPEQVEYRQQAVTDLEQEAVEQVIRAFVGEMNRSAKLLKLVDSRGDPHQCARWMVAVVRIYCDAIGDLAHGLEAAEPESEAFQGLWHYLRAYLESDEFTQLEGETTALEQRFAEVRYEVRIRGLHVTVTPYEGSQSLADEVEQLFARFTRGAADDHNVALRQAVSNDRIESQVLELVSRHNPELFGAAADFLRRNHDTYVDPVIARFDREIRFLLAYQDYIAPLRARGLRFCMPKVSNTDQHEEASQCFDLALAHQLASDRVTVVCNDFRLDGDERMFVITGPNQGGKTTFARMFGQVHHLAALGLPVPSSTAQLFLPDRIFTHFEREENLQTLRSKFEDELVRLHAILEQATADSLLVMNESFSSTSLRDALWVGQRILGRILEMGTISLCVTFIDEFARLGPQVVSMMSAVDPDDVTRRTFKVVRKPADGLAYAVALADKHGVGYQQLKERLA